MTKKILDITSAREELISIIDNFISLSDTGELRTKVKAIVPAILLLRELGINLLKTDEKISARDRILIYLARYPLTIIDSDELLAISGITDYQRRIRELRVEHGWPILGGRTARSMFEEGEWPVMEVDVSRMKPKEYIMLNTGQDDGAANRWKSINTLRKSDLSVKDKLKTYFLDNVKREITGEELAYLANGASEWGRRVRELRTEDGWSIKTGNTGRPDLPVGVYVLEDDRQAEPHDRGIDDKTRVAVLQRDKFSCRKCGWNRSKEMDGDPRHNLQLHHLDYHADKGSNTQENLITVCNVDHSEIHKKHMSKIEVLEWMGITSGNLQR